MKKKYQIHWHNKPQESNYLAALSYLSLLFPEREAAKMVMKLRKTRVSEFKAKDIFRASGLSLLGISNSRIEKDRSKIKEQIPLSPILLVRSQKSEKVIVADGYHRLCALYYYDEGAVIPCKII